MTIDGYIRPDVISSEMGGSIEQPDDRLQDVIRLLKHAPLDKYQSFLDVGIGGGQIATWLAKMGKKVTGIGLELSSYDQSVKALKKNYDIDIFESSVECMPFKDHSFDVVIMSHILEHCPNVGLALQEVRRVLNNHGQLYLFVPPNDDFVCAGHISVGWNIGQLMYVLLLNGFDVKSGNFIQYGYNVCAFVNKSTVQLPKLRGDKGDIHILGKAGLWPLAIETENGLDDGFWGNIPAINWNFNLGLLNFPPKKQSLFKALVSKLNKDKHRDQNRNITVLKG